jgi:hypothetical protein
MPMAPNAGPNSHIDRKSVHTSTVRLPSVTERRSPLQASGRRDDMPTYMILRITTNNENLCRRRFDNIEPAETPAPTGM